MKKAILPAAILCTVLCIGLSSQPGEEAKPASEPTPLPMQAEVPAAPAPEIGIPEPKAEEPIKEAASPAPTTTPAATPEQTAVPTETPVPTPVPAPASASAPTTPQPVQAGNMVYVDGFGWLESQGEGTVIYDEMMYENGNKVGSMG